MRSWAPRDRQTGEHSVAVPGREALGIMERERGDAQAELCGKAGMGKQALSNSL